MRKNYIFSIVAMMALVYGQAQTYTKKAGKSTMLSEIIQKSSEQPQARAVADLSDGFETYENFTLSFAPWTLTDVDGSETWGIEGIDFTNQYAPMSFMIFNPSVTVPPMTTASIQPHGGSKLAACFAASTPPNNDWLISPPLTAGTNTSVSFWVKSYTSQYGLERYKVGISTTNTAPGSFTIISGANYLTAPATGWEQKTYDLNAYNGQTVYVGIQCVSEDAFIFMVDDFNFTTTTNQGNSITGLVTDAINGNPIAGALVSVAGLSATTDSQGNYTINNIPAGALVANFNANQTSGTAALTVVFTDQSTENSNTVTCSKTGYSTYGNNQVVIPAGGSLTLNISLSPDLVAGNIRFVLNWSASPEDLDSHLNTPEIQGQRHHIFYLNEGSATESPFALLDYDITTGYGPETMTIYQMFNGTYQYYIYNYSETPSITTSQAVVQIYNQSGLIHTLQVPGGGTGLFWYVCDVNGSNGQITLRNVIQTDAPGSFRDKMPAKEPKPLISNERTITSWAWDFGDGGTSTLQNPTHTFNANGTYTISLTVSNSSAQATEIKEAYIQVGPEGIGENTLSQQIKLYPVPASREMQIDSPEKIELLRVTDLSGLEIFRCRVDNFTYKLNVENMGSGLYFLLIDTQKSRAVQKFTIK